MPQENRLERKSRMLALQMRRMTEALAQQMRGPSDRDLYSKHLTAPESLRFWRQHRNDKFGKAVIDRWMAQDQAQAMVDLQELDAALAAQVEAEGSPFAQGGPDAA